MRKILRNFDFFGESFTFRYKNEGKHSTELGGIMCIIFYVIAITYFIYNFVPFYRKENFTLQFYSMKLNETEKIHLTQYPTYFAFALTTNNKIDDNIKDLLTIEVNFINQKNKDSSKIISFRPCEYTDFLINESEIEKSLINQQIKDLNCIDKQYLSEYEPEGIYTDDIFTYYEITVKINSNLGSNGFENINEYLTNNDCKLQFYYTDISFDPTNKVNPFSPFIDSMFIQLNPTLIQKRNIFFLKYHLIDDDVIFHFGGDKYDKPSMTGFSRVEDYALYKGLSERNNSSNKNNDLYAKMYIRADNKLVYIKRKYQDFMEFYADTSALLLSIFWIMGVFFAYFDRIKANHSISKKLFYFEGIVNNQFKQFNELKHVIKESEQLLVRNQNFQHNNPIIYTRNNTISGTAHIPESNENIIGDNYIRRNTTSQLKIPVKKIDKNKLIDYSSYNIFEMIGRCIPSTLKTKKYKNKMRLIDQANIIINDKLDIVYYIRHMISFDIINQINLENKNIINFLSRPIIYLRAKRKGQYKNEINDILTNTSLETEGQIEERVRVEKNDIEFSQYFSDERYPHTYHLNSQVLMEKIKNLILIPNKTKEENNLLMLLKKQLNEV